ncbi:MAG: HEAT repeat domain-containing protein [Polyangiaceae bacterium]|nr:HEAT repeat domain-containing protein [Polyangiaceae bacterium]MCL4749416.1 HEAT repeat domain-containing protein [Myxococcales bacterium]
MFGLSPLPRTLAAALRDAGDKKLEVRVSAVRDLGRHAREGADVAVERLRRVLSEDSAVAVRAEAAVALADAGARAALPALVEAAGRDDAPRVRQMALVALGELGQADDEDATRVIERALRDEQPELRFQALIAFAQLQGAGALDVLHRFVRDEDPHVRYVALRLAEERWLESGDVELPERLGNAARAALDDTDTSVKLAAALVLGRAGDKSGASVIVDAVRSGQGAAEPEDAEAAIELAGALGLDDARGGLARRAFGVFGVSRDPFAWQARVALARLGDARARQAILRGLGSWSRDARTLAVAAAGRARLAEARPLLEAMQGKPDRAEPSAVEEALGLLAPPEGVDARTDRGEDERHDSAPRQDPGPDP